MNPKNGVSYGESERRSRMPGERGEGATKNCNCKVKTFVHEGPRRAAKGHEEGQGQRQNVNGNFFWPGRAGLAGAYSSSQFMITGNSRIRSCPSAAMQITG